MESVSVALLDTNALLFALREPDRLGKRARQAIDSRSSRLLVSAASAWEVATKVRIGKLPGGEYFITRWDAILNELGAESLPVTHEHGAWAGSLAWGNRDPFDRMLAAQAMIERAPLVTADSAFGDLDGLSTIW